MPPQSDLEVAPIAGFECAALSFQPPLELGARHHLKDTTHMLRQQAAQRISPLIWLAIGGVIVLFLVHADELLRVFAKP